MTTLAAVMARETNGFAALRLALALAVVVSHGFSAATGAMADEPLTRSTGFTLGEHAVNGFFAISGFLVAASAERRSPLDYARARLLRIAPGFVVATLVVTFGLGAALTRWPLGAYLADPATWRFAWRTLTAFKTNAALPGVFEGNALALPLGTVWTLKYEVFCYAGLLVAALAGALRTGVAALALPAALAVALAVLDPTAKGVETALRLPLIFALGAALHVCRERAPLSGWIVAALAIAALAARDTALYRPLLFVGEAYGAVWLALAPRWPAALDPRQDLSYGIYLYGWPIQQSVHALWPGIAPTAAIPLALGLTLPVAAASWFLVERPALALKVRRPRDLPTAPA